MKITATSLEELKAVYDEHGVAILPAQFDSDEVQLLRRAAINSLTLGSEITRKGYGGNPIEKNRFSGHECPSLIFWPSLCEKVINQFRGDPRLVSLAQALLGDNIKQLNNQFYYRLGGDEDSFAWHQDIMFRHPRSEYPGIVEKSGYLQTAIIVDEVTDTNGPIEYILGSHKLGDLSMVDFGAKNLRGFDREQDERLKNLETIKLHAQPGDLVVWSSLIVHGSEPNNSKHSRMYYMNGFAKAECATHWPLYLNDGEWVEQVNVKQVNKGSGFTAWHQTKQKLGKILGRHS